MTTDSHAPSLVVGLGNPILGDDGVGWHVIDELERRLRTDAGLRRQLDGVVLERQAIGGLALMERLVGHSRAVVVDALLDGSPPGTVSAHPLGDLSGRAAGHLDSAHDVPLTVAIAAGRALGAGLPAEIVLVGIAVRVVDQFAEGLSPPVAAAVPAAADAVTDALVRALVRIA